MTQFLLDWSSNSSWVWSLKLNWYFANAADREVYDTVETVAMESVATETIATEKIPSESIAMETTDAETNNADVASPICLE